MHNPKYDDYDTMGDLQICDKILWRVDYNVGLVKKNISVEYSRSSAQQPRLLKKTGRSEWIVVTYGTQQVCEAGHAVQD